MVRLPLHITMFFITLLLVCACSGKTNSDGVGKSIDTDNREKSPPEITFQEKVHAFGDLIEGEKVAYTFTFKNTGNSNLLVKDVKADCGCTTPHWDKQPVKPGESGRIEVVFDSSGRQGNQFKSIKIFTNTPEKEYTLAITANVKTNV